MRPPTTFEFVAPLTAIVGPNGSGKSNVADAVRWVLGEQSLRLLRGRKTEDVIFAGSAQRAPVGLAEVQLTLDNSTGWLPLPHAEVTLTRRAHRSGENEYPDQPPTGAPARVHRPAAPRQYWNARL